MIAATLFSGIGAPELAMPGWSWRWHAEIEPFPAAVMAARHAGSVNLGDVLADGFAEKAQLLGRPDVLVFGSPCQSFSVAGRRLGLSDPRGNLALTAMRLVRSLRPDWFVFENVPGLLSDDRGRSFAAFLEAVAESGYSGAWRVLDARYWHLAQRRERVFFVGCVGDWRGPAAVLSFAEGLRGYPEKGGKARQDIARPLAACPAGGSGRRNDSDTAENCIVAYGGNNTAGPIDIATAVNAHGGPCGRMDFESETFVAHAFDARQSDVVQYGDVTGSLDTDGSTIGVQQGYAVRRLTPMEAERLQGFPDGFTAIEYRGKPAKDGPRYRAIGNAMAVPVLRWLLSRIEAHATRTARHADLARFACHAP